MPKLNVPEPAPVVLAAIGRAFQNPVAWTPEECAEFEAFRRRARVRRTETRFLERRGKLVYRSVGKRGADLPVHPLIWEAAKRELRFLWDPNGVQAHLPPDPMRGVRSRQAKAAVRSAPILALFEKYQSRGRACVGLIVRAMAREDVVVNERYVRRVIAKFRSRP